MRATVVLLTLALAAPAAAGEAIVIDGDTMVMDGRRIRLDGMDAPELRQLCRDAAGRRYRCGLAAARKLEALVIGQDVTCTTTGRDRRNRDVARCATPRESDIGAAMVRSGWAVDYARYSGGRYQADERTAQEGRRGLWRGPFMRPDLWRARQITRP